MELILELDRKAPNDPGSLSTLIRKKRFESYNSEWLTTISSVENEMESNDYQDGYDNSAIRRRQPNYYTNNDGNTTSFEHQQSPLIEETSHVNRPRTFSGEEVNNILIY